MGKEDSSPPDLGEEDSELCKNQKITKGRNSLMVVGGREVVGQIPSLELGLEYNTPSNTQYNHQSSKIKKKKKKEDEEEQRGMILKDRVGGGVAIVQIPSLGLGSRS